MQMRWRFSTGACPHYCSSCMMMIFSSSPPITAAIPRGREAIIRANRSRFCAGVRPGRRARSVAARRSGTSGRRLLHTWTCLHSIGERRSWRSKPTQCDPDDGRRFLTGIFSRIPTNESSLPPRGPKPVTITSAGSLPSTINSQIQLTIALYKSYSARIFIEFTRRSVVKEQTFLHSVEKCELLTDCSRATSRFQPLTRRRCRSIRPR
jgi:hypothetical protein